jgi:hypothetical protein
MKTVQDYLNDPRLLNDPFMDEDTPEPIKELRAIRLKIQDETEGMSPKEHVEYFNKRGREILEKAGIKAEFINRAGQGKRIYKKPTLENTTIQDCLNDPGLLFVPDIGKAIKALYLQHSEYSGDDTQEFKQEAEQTDDKSYDKTVETPDPVPVIAEA